MPIELVNSQKDPADAGGLRLVPENRDPSHLRSLEKQFVNFIFLRVNPEWRQLGQEEKEECKREFESVFNSFRSDFQLFSYSLVGFDSKADLMFWRIGTSMDGIQEMTAAMFRTRLGSFLDTSDSFLAVTKGMMFVPEKSEERYFVTPGEKKYHFLYPCAKNRDWYEKPAEERDALIEENFMVGRRFPNIKIHLTHAFGFSDQEYLISFETDEPKDFLALTEELRQTPAAKFTMRGMPVYTCRQRPLRECLDSLG